MPGPSPGIRGGGDGDHFGRIKVGLPHRDEYFDHQIALMADLVGLPR